MKIAWHKVTWYSKLLAVALLIAAIAITYYFYIEFKKVGDIEVEKASYSDSIPENVVMEKYQNDKYGFEFQYPKGINVEFLQYIRSGGIIGMPAESPKEGHVYIPTPPNLDRYAGRYLVDNPNPARIVKEVIAGQPGRIVYVKTTAEAFCTGCMNGDYAVIIVELPKPITIDGQTHAFLEIGNENIPAQAVSTILSTFKFTK